jgi:glucose-1-phosphate cytidylyltransferase
MKTILLAGGFGTRLSEYTEDIPKPMVPIGGLPMLWHIMSIYSHFGHNEFLLALGYKADYVKSFFINYETLHSDFIIDMATGKTRAVERPAVDWKLALIDTGLDTMTGGRIKRMAPWVMGDTFMATYGDGVSNVDINDLIAFHKKHGKLVTMTLARPAARFGIVDFDADGVVHSFKEKPIEAAGYVNSGFFVMEPKFLEYIDNDKTILEREPLERAAAEGELMGYVHDGFWRPMDTKRDVDDLNRMWHDDSAPWKMWSLESSSARKGRGELDV